MAAATFDQRSIGGGWPWYRIGRLMQALLERDAWHPAELHGRSVNLRRHRMEDLPAVVRWYRDPELGRLTRYHANPMSAEEVERFFRGRLMADDALAYGIEEVPS